MEKNVLMTLLTVEIKTCKSNTVTLFVCCMYNKRHCVFPKKKWGPSLWSKDLNCDLCINPVVSTMMPAIINGLIYSYVEKKSLYFLPVNIQWLCHTVYTLYIHGDSRYLYFFWLISIFYHSLLSMMYRNKRYQNKWLTGFSKLIMVFTLNMLNIYLSVMPHLVFFSFYWMG